MRFRTVALLALPLAIVAAACSRSPLKGESPGEEGGAGSGGSSGGSAGSTAGTTAGTTTTTVVPGSCGDALLQDPEQCDDGNSSFQDACLPDCTLAFCGDGFIHIGFEQCDDGNPEPSDDCVFCAVAFCGDGFLHAALEQCDDANKDNNDGCSNNCVAVMGACGNGVVDPGEQCDDGNASNSDWCVIGCKKADCGDGFLQVGVEQCDDGNVVSGDGCNGDCTLPGSECGNGIAEANEECDDGNASNQDECLSSCKKAFCGDGFTFLGFEECDDANGSSTDACVAGCKAAKCGDGFLRVGVELCDDGNVMNGDGCNGDCTLPVVQCGNGMLDPGEACDLGAGNADRPAFLLTSQMASAPVLPVVTVEDAAIFYNYFSASGHTGFEAQNTSILFLYASSSTKALSLFTLHGIDFTTTGIFQTMAHVEMDFTGLPAASVVALSDDTPGEFFKSSATSVHGSWDFQQNSDGGVISGLPFPGSWSITVKPGFSPPIATWQFENGGAMPAPIALGPSAVLQAFDTPSPCRKNCTVPACGDAILDGGEVCDDGNTAGGDGCAADCKGF